LAARRFSAGLKDSCALARPNLNIYLFCILEYQLKAQPTGGAWLNNDNYENIYSNII